MEQVRFLHFADLHLDSPFTSLGSEIKARARRQELKACLKRIIDEAASQKADLLLISGDLYEHEYADRKTILYAAEEFGSIPATKVIIIPGNHDPFTGNSYYKSLQWPDNVHILVGPGINSSYIVFDDIKTSVYTQTSMPEIQAGSRNGSQVPFKPGYFNILLLHGTLNMAFSRNAWNPLQSSTLDKLGMDYIALGHFHSRLEGGGAGRNIFNPGSPEPLGFDEAGSHGIYAGTLASDENGIKTRQVRYLPLNQRSYLKLDVNTDGCCTDEQIIRLIAEAIRSAGKPEDLYEIRLRGYTDESLVPDEAYISESAAREVFCVRVINEALPGFNYEVIAAEPGLRGLFTRKLLERINAAASDKERLLAERALIMGLEAMDNNLKSDFLRRNHN